MWADCGNMLPPLLFSSCVTDRLDSSIYTQIFIIFKKITTVAPTSQDSLRIKWVNLCQVHRGEGFKVSARF